MDITKYAGYFHDGYVNSISHVGNNISFSLESSIIEDSSDILDEYILSDSNSFKGILSIENIKSFKVGGEKYNDVFQMQYDDGNILDLEIKDNRVFLLVEWKNFPPKASRTGVSRIEIEAEKIQWIPEKSMNIKKYIDYFHGGGLIGVKKKGGDMELFVRSCEISLDEPIDRKLLSEDSALKGKLCLTGVKWIKIDNKEDEEIPWKNYDDGEILDLEINNNKIFLLVEWKNWPPKPSTRDVSKIEIAAEKIHWENIPGLSDDYFKEI